MVRCCDLRSRRRLSGVLNAVTSCLLPATLLAGCGGAIAKDRLPAKPSITVSSATEASQSPSSERQQVIAAFVGYSTALHQANLSRSTSTARRLLRPYLIADRIDGLVRAESKIWASGEVFYGQPVLHVLSVRIVGHRAFVHDCDDTSRMSLLRSSDDRTVPGSSGTLHDNVVTTLTFIRGRWLVEYQLVEDVPCEP